MTGREIMDSFGIAAGRNLPGQQEAQRQRAGD